MRGIQRPLIIYTSRKPFYDRCAEDMKCGDLDEKTLKERFGLLQVSERVNCYTFQKLAIPAYGDMPFLSKDQVAGILFDQLRFEAGRFAFWGPYTGIIQRLFTHMQYGNGKDFYDVQMNQAYKRMIEGDKTPGSTLAIITNLLSQFDFNKRPLSIDDFRVKISAAHLPKYSRFADNFNGLGISIHDMNSTKITIESLTFTGNQYSAIVKYTGQDHFGLDTTDISNMRFKFLKVFQIWFILQHYRKLAFKPFFTNMEARIAITGKNNA